MSDIDTVLHKSLPVKDIILGERFRRDLGDYKELAGSINEIGLLHPIVVDKDNKLVAGARRLEACAGILGWKEIPVTIIDIEDLIKGELHENTLRKDFTFSERQAIIEAVKPALEKEAEERQKSGVPAANLVQGRTDDKLSRVLGISRGTIAKEEAIAEAIKENPTDYKDLVERIDSGEESIDHAYKTLVGDNDTIDEEADNARARIKLEKQKKNILTKCRALPKEIIKSIIEELQKELEQSG